MKRRETRWGPRLALSVLVHAALLLAFASTRPAPLVEPAAAPEKPGKRQLSSRRSESREAPEREAPPQRRTLRILGAGRADHDARADDGIPGIATPSAPAEAAPSALVKLPTLAPEQRENPREQVQERSRRAAEETRSVQRPEIAPGLDLRLDGQAARAAQAAGGGASAAKENGRDAHRATPPEAAVADDRPRLAREGGDSPSPAQAASEQGGAPVAAAVADEGPSKGAVAVEASSRAKLASREATGEERDPAASVASEQPAAPSKQVGKGAGEGRGDERGAGEGRAGVKPAEPAATPTEELRAEIQPQVRGEREVRVSAQSGVERAVGEAPTQAGEPRLSPEPVAGERSDPAPVLLALAEPTRRVGPDGRAEGIAVAAQAARAAEDGAVTESQPSPVVVLEGGEEGAQRADETALALASAERATTGEPVGPVHEGLAPQAGWVVVAPAGSGLGERRGMASVGGSGEVRRLAQERVNHVVRLVGPSAVRRAGAAGIAVVEFRVDARGYVRDLAVLRSSGSPQLDREIEPILRLGEPYPGCGNRLKVALGFEWPAIE